MAKPVLGNATFEVEKMFGVLGSLSEAHVAGARVVPQHHDNAASETRVVCIRGSLEAQIGATLELCSIVVDETTLTDTRSDFWAYKDPKGRSQGPFPLSKVLQWSAFHPIKEVWHAPSGWTLPTTLMRSLIEGSRAEDTDAHMEDLSDEGVAAVNEAISTARQQGDMVCDMEIDAAVPTWLHAEATWQRQEPAGLIRLFVVLDTNVLLTRFWHAQKVLEVLAAAPRLLVEVAFVVPWVVSCELDGLKQGRAARKKPDTVDGHSRELRSLARHACRKLASLVGRSAAWLGQSVEMARQASCIWQGIHAAVQAAEQFPLPGRQHGTNDEQIMQCCLHLQQRFSGQRGHNLPSADVIPLPLKAKGGADPSYAWLLQPDVGAALLSEDNNLVLKACQNQAAAVKCKEVPTQGPVVLQQALVQLYARAKQASVQDVVHFLQHSGQQRQAAPAQSTNGAAGLQQQQGLRERQGSGPLQSPQLQLQQQQQHQQAQQQASLAEDLLTLQQQLPGAPTRVLLQLLHQLCPQGYGTDIAGQPAPAQLQIPGPNGRLQGAELPSGSAQQQQHQTHQPWSELGSPSAQLGPQETPPTSQATQRLGWDRGSPAQLAEAGQSGNPWGPQQPLATGLTPQEALNAALQQQRADPRSEHHRHVMAAGMQQEAQQRLAALSMRQTSPSAAQDQAFMNASEIPAEAFCYAGSLQRGRSLDYAHQLQASHLLQQGTLAAQPSHSLPTDSGGAQDLRNDLQMHGDPAPLQQICSLDFKDASGDALLAYMKSQSASFEELLDQRRGTRQSIAAWQAQLKRSHAALSRNARLTRQDVGQAASAVRDLLRAIDAPSAGDIRPMCSY
eukprot:jgi/Astpho2/10008/Aster-06818